MQPTRSLISTAFELHEFLGAHVPKSRDQGDAVADLHHAAGVQQLDDLELRL
jgi:hypothetical protein